MIFTCNKLKREREKERIKINVIFVCQLIQKSSSAMKQQKQWSGSVEEIRENQPKKRSAIIAAAFDD